MRTVVVAEWAEAGKETVGQGRAVDTFNNAGLRLACLSEKGLTEVVGHLVLEDVAYKTLADICSAALIAKDETKGWIAEMDVVSIIIA